ncbi:MAG: serine hydrolase [Oscillospiraceae bacterium]|nr:serine hydrolase [Oscillospiraceae bacterium]
MMRRAKRLLALLLCLAALCSLLPAACAEQEDEWDFSSRTLDEVIGQFVSEHRLSEDNFAMGFYDTVSGEEWYYNPDGWFVAASMYKLPLNMIYADALADGETTEKTPLGGRWSVGSAMRASMVKSDNEASQLLLGGLGLKGNACRERMAAYSGLDADELPNAYYNRNHMSPRFMIGTLRALYEGGEKYDVLIDYMKQAQPGRYFRSGEAGAYEIAHKYGAIAGFRNDCGIVYTPRPFLLVVFTQNVSGGEKLLGEVCRMMTAYSLSRAAEEG